MLPNYVVPSFKLIVLFVILVLNRLDKRETILTEAQYYDAAALAKYEKVINFFVST